MHDFAEYITPERAAELHKGLAGAKTVEEYGKLAKKRRKCMVCGQPAWRMVDTDLCFSCTTGESDASDDYELIQL